MAMTWSQAAEDSLFEILNFYELEVGLDFAESIENRIYAQVENLRVLKNLYPEVTSIQLHASSLFQNYLTSLLFENDRRAHGKW
jgi:plasmid stabilization system protein ParE